MTEQLEQSKALKEQMLEHLELRSDPFVPGQGPLYLGAQRQHILEAIRHMGIFGDLILLLLGDRGAGKTTLLRHFAAEQNDQLQTHFLAAGGEFSGQGVIARIRQLLGLVAVEGETQEQELMRCMQAMQLHFKRTQRRALLIVDDAESLPLIELRCLLKLFSALPEEAPAVLLLSGAPELSSLVTAEAGTDTETRVHALPLKPFTRDEVLEYLQLCLQAVGYAGELQLSDQQAATLAEGGKGLPGRINRVFPAVMMGAKVFETAPANAAGMESVSKILAGVVALLLLSFGFVAYQYGLFASDPRIAEPSSEAFESVSVLQGQAQEKLREERLAKLDEAIAEQLQESESLPGDDRGSADDRSAPVGASQSEAPQGSLSSSGPSSELVATAAAPDAEANLALQVELMSEVPAESEAEAVRQADEQAFAQERGQAHIKSDPISETASFAESEPVQNVLPVEEMLPLRSGDWVRSQPPEDYSIQVLGSHNRDTATRFIAEGERKGVDFYYIEAVRKSKPWFVVLYGHYESKDAARSALNAAPNWLRAQKPWLRSFAGIQASLPPS